MPLDPAVYAKMLREKVEKHDVSVWLLNTGWTGGAYGVGKRFSIQLTRQLLHAALDGKLDSVEYDTHAIFNLAMPKTCEGVPEELLDPRNTWTDKADYDKQARELAGMCVDAFKQYEGTVSEDVIAARPNPSA